jgi:hypothetical protein
MAVADFDEDSTGCSLFISHPVKSFKIQASSPAEKKDWLRDLLWVIQDCTRRLHERNVVEEKVRSFYIRYKPEKLNDIGFIMNKYKGRELLLLEQLEMQYNKPGACSSSQFPSATSVLSPVPVLNCSTDISIEAVSKLTKSILMSRINDQQQEIIDNGKVVISVSAAPSPWVSSREQHHREQMHAPDVKVPKEEASDRISDTETAVSLSTLSEEDVTKVFHSGLKIWRSLLDDPEKIAMSDAIFKVIRNI